MGWAKVVFANLTGVAVYFAVTWKPGVWIPATVCAFATLDFILRDLPRSRR